jgi:uncharacterized protein YecE (DUF72 family)
MAWERMLEIAMLLKAGAVLFQTPRSYLPTEENLDRMRRFFSSIERETIRMVFEPRGEAWSDAILRPLLNELNLVHAVDPFLRRPLGHGLRYFRLHGRPAYHYHYRYSDEELVQLRDRLSGTWPNLVLFNNDRMAEDARRFRRMLTE